MVRGPVPTPLTWPPAVQDALRAMSAPYHDPDEERVRRLVV
jgi:hypothetical protein